MYQKGQIISVHSYKHDKSLHRVWERAEVMLEDDEKIIIANKRTKVIESNGRFWYSKEPSVTYFYKNQMFNIIGIIKGDEVNYYCNISSPVLIDDEAMKYIDYDLDLKVDSNFKYTVLDKNEFKRHRLHMNYSDKLVKILINELEILEKMVTDREEPFNKKCIFDWYNKFLNK